MDDPKHSNAEKCWAVFGRTDAGRLLTVIFTKRGQLNKGHLCKGYEPKRKKVL